jgi:hypothetical protein
MAGTPCFEKPAGNASGLFGFMTFLPKEIREQPFSGPFGQGRSWKMLPAPKKETA